MVSNTGPCDATNVVVSDTLPSEIENAIASASSGSCSIVGGLLTCQIARLGVGGQAVIVINGYVSSDAAGTIANTASAVSDADSTGVDSTANTTVAATADVALVVDSTPTANGGETVIVTYTVTNIGPSVADNAVVTATFPSGTSAPSGWTLVSGTTYTKSVGSLNSGQTTIVTASVTVDAGTQPGTSLEFTGYAASDTADGNLVNNGDRADSSVIGSADLVISKTGTATANAGELVTYTIIITNNGPSLARNVDVKDQLPDGLTLVSATRQQFWRVRRVGLPVGDLGGERQPDRHSGGPHRQRHRCRKS